MCFFFNDTATTEIYTLSLHDALPIWQGREDRPAAEARPGDHRPGHEGPPEDEGGAPLDAALDRRALPRVRAPGRDRKSTRLNSSHANISYAVFCLKKKIIV